MVYDSVEHYLDDYTWQIKRLAYNNSLYERDFLSDELLFNEAKKQFINFILEKTRTTVEIDEFLKPYNSDIKDRLERLTSKKFTSNELTDNIQKIKQLKTDLKNKEAELKHNKKEFDLLKDPTLKRGINSKKVNTNLFDLEDIKEIDGIYIWNADYSNEEKIEEVDE